MKNITLYPFSSLFLVLSVSFPSRHLSHSLLLLLLLLLPHLLCPIFFLDINLSLFHSISSSHFLFPDLSTSLFIWLTLPTPYDSTELLSFLLPFALSPQPYLVTHKRPACNSSGVRISQRTACFCHVRVTTASCTRACKPLHDRVRTHSLTHVYLPRKLRASLGDEFRPRIHRSSFRFP